MEYANSVAVVSSRPLEQQLTRLNGRKPASRAKRKKQTFQEYLETEWLPQYETQVKPASFYAAASQVRLYIGPALGNIPVDHLTRDDILAFYARLFHTPSARGDRPLSRTSIQRVHATIHTALEDLVLAGRLPANPAHGLRKKRSRWEHHEFRIWTPQELDHFLRETRQDSLFPMWRILAWTGMRRGEAIGLRWGDLRADSKTITIRRAVCLIERKCYISTPKSAQARALALDRGTLAILRRHHTAQARASRAAGRAEPGPHDWMFPAADGDHLSPSLVTYRFKRRVEEIGLPGIRLHDLRHTHASHLILSGANIKAVQERLGHADIVLTLNIYSHLLPTTQEESLNGLTRFYGRGN